MIWVIEGEWSGYSSSQQRIVHREYTTSRKRADAISAQYGIRYSDGTMLYLSVREAKPREKRRPINGYGGLIDKCLRYNVWSVDELQKVNP